MDGLNVLLLVFSGIVSCSHNLMSGSVLEVTARPGDNITLYCDCKQSSGVYIVWLRNCSHENQPSLILRTYYRSDLKVETNQKSPRFRFLKNSSSDSYDLLIMNVSVSDEGLYYCGTEEKKVENKGLITSKHVYIYSNMTTRLIVMFEANSTDPHLHEPLKLCHVCWTLLFSLSPAFIVLSSLLVYCPCPTTAKDPQDDEKSADTEGQLRRILDEELYCAALEIRQAAQRPKRETNWSSELTFCTFSAVKTFRG